MPPTLKIYVASGHRNQYTIDRFINEWVDREASEDRGDEVQPEI